jgi:excisionase family DNA binding protein
VALATPTREHVSRPFAVTSHAVKRYRERIDPSASRDEAIAALLRMLQTPAFERQARDGAILYGCRDGRDRRVGVLVMPSRAEGEWPVVVTCGGWLLWQEFKRDWERMYVEGRWAGAPPRKHPALRAVASPPESEPEAQPASTQAKRKAAGLCLGCGKVAPAEGRVRCPECLAAHAARVRQKRQERATAGLCSRCGKRPPVSGRRRCAECRAVDREREVKLRQIRPDHAPSPKPTPYRQNQVDVIARYVGYRTPEWIAKRLGISARRVRNLIWQEGLCPTQRDELLTTGEAAEILGYTQQWVLRLVKAGKLRGHRNPGGRWMLIPRESVQSYLKAHGQTSRDPRLTAPVGWPRAVLASHRRPR